MYNLFIFCLSNIKISIYQIVYQSSVWIPLVSIKCHKDTQLFLCSLFAPICLDQAIYPCRSLCESVRNGCEVRMNQYSYQWPSMFNCSKFPEDNGLCIQPEVSSQIENISDNLSTKIFTTTTTTTPASTVKIKIKPKTTTETYTSIKKIMQSDKNINKQPFSKMNQECIGCSGLNTEDNIIELFCSSDIGEYKYET